MLPFLLSVIDDNQYSSSEEEGVEIHLETVELTLGTLDLREFEIQPSQNRKRRRRKKEKSKLQNEGESGSVCHDVQ